MKLIKPDKIDHFDQFKYGIIPYSNYLKYKKLSDHDWIKSILVFAFGYQYQNEQKVDEGFITSKFAYGKDYHQVLKEILNKIAFDLELKNYEVMVDVSYLDEKLCAYLAGLGSYGKNNLIISPKYGTNFVIGEIVTDCEDFYYNEPIENQCIDCDLCIKACPVAALNNGFNRTLCLSYLTQSASHDYQKFDKIKYAFGCDICQEVCPKNIKTYSFLNEFKFDEKSNLSLNRLLELNNQTYKEYYHDKTFNWISHLKMLRNIIVLLTISKKITYEEIEKIQNDYKNVTWFYNHMEYLKGKIKNGI